MRWQTPGADSAGLSQCLIEAHLDSTGDQVPDVESGFMTSITSKTFEAQGHYQVVVYHTGQPEQFDRINSLSRQVSGAVPLGMIPELLAVYPERMPSS